MVRSVAKSWGFHNAWRVVAVLVPIQLELTYEVHCHYCRHTPELLTFVLQEKFMTDEGSLSILGTSHSARYYTRSFLCLAGLFFWSYSVLAWVRRKTTFRDNCVMFLWPCVFVVAHCPANLIKYAY